MIDKIPFKSRRNIQLTPIRNLMLAHLKARTTKDETHFHNNKKTTNVRTFLDS